MNGRGRSVKPMISPERSQRPSTNLTQSSWRHYASCVVVQNSPASGFSEFLRVGLPWKLSFVVSSSPRSRVCNSQEVSSLVWHMKVFCRWLRMGLSVASAQSARGSGGGTRRMRCAISGNSTLGWLMSALLGMSCIMHSFEVLLSAYAFFHSHKSIYSTGEMKSHRCAPSQNQATQATAMELEASSDSLADDSRN